MKGIRALIDIYHQYSDSELLIVGHTDRSGQPSYNDPLSVERADSVAAFVTDDVDAWLTRYKSNVSGEKRWGTIEDFHMLESLADFSTKPETQSAVEWFQETRGLTVDNDAGTETRRQLIIEYMAHDETTLPAGIKMLTHGCGENFPLDDAGNIDTNAPDGEKDDKDRRVEVFVFDKPGIRPKPKGKNSRKGSKEYPKWRQHTTKTHDFRAKYCPTRFGIEAPCKIIKVNGGKVQISAVDYFSGGSFAWTTTSSKIKLINSNSSTVTVEGLATPSASRGAETITVTRTESGCPPVVKTVQVTVAKVTFSVSTNQRYGYDDFDTPTKPLDDHICIKKSDHTFLKVDIQGGALGTDFDFVCDDPSVCTPVAPGAKASFDLRLNAGAKNKNATTLHANVKCPSVVSFSSIQVHVYKEKLVEVVVAKVYDSKSAATTLHRPTMNAAAHTATVNAKLKEAVVKFNISNYTPSNSVTDIEFDLDSNGALSYDINAGGGVELDKIKKAITGTGTKTRIAIIKKLKSYYYLSQAVAIGEKDLKVRGTSVFKYGSFPNVPLGLGANMENVTVSSVSGNTITLASGVTKAHTVGTPIEFIAGGWASDPIVITEENAADGSLIAEKLILWSIPHEVGHRKLELADIVDQTNFMHYNQSWTDYRLRYCPRTKRYTAGTENQWEKIPR